MKTRASSVKKVSPTREAMKTKKENGRRRGIEREYETVFSPHPLPYQGIYTDEDSLEQPSALRYVPTTATPAVEPATAPRGYEGAELERSF